VGPFCAPNLLFEVGETLSLEIPLVGDETLAARGRVHGSPARGAPIASGMGIEFEKLSPQDRRRLTQSLRRLAQPDGRKSA